MDPVTTPVIVTSFAPDISGNVFVLVQSQDGNSNARLLITQQQKGSLQVGDSLDLTIGTANSGVAAVEAPLTDPDPNLAIDLRAQIASLQEQVTAATAANSDLQAQLDAAQAAAKATP